MKFMALVLCDVMRDHKSSRAGSSEAHRSASEGAVTEIHLLMSLQVQCIPNSKKYSLGVSECDPT